MLSRQESDPTALSKVCKSEIKWAAVWQALKGAISCGLTGIMAEACRLEGLHLSPSSFPENLEESFLVFREEISQYPLLGHLAWQLHKPFQFLRQTGLSNFWRSKTMTSRGPRPGSQAQETRNF